MSLDHILPASNTGEPDSQFLPRTNIQFAWDSVSLTNILSCPRRYQYSIVLGLQPKASSFAIALVFGILLHKGLEYAELAKASGADQDQTIIAAVSQMLTLPAAETLPTDEEVDEIDAGEDSDDGGITARNSKVRTRYYLARALVWYLEHYAADPAQTLILSSGKPAVELSYRVPIELDGVDHPMLLCGHIDRVVDFNGALYVSDYKTTKAISRQFFLDFDLSHQMSGYITAGQVILDQPVRGSIIDGIALQVGGVKLGRGITTRTKGQTAEYLRTLVFAQQQATKFYEQDFYPMNTSACFFCQFKEACRQPPEYRANYLKQHFEQKRGWNPLESR